GPVDNGTFRHQAEEAEEAETDRCPRRPYEALTRQSLVAGAGQEETRRRDEKDKAQSETQGNMSNITDHSEGQGAEKRSSHRADAEACMEKRHRRPTQSLLDGDAMRVHGDIHAADRRAENERGGEEAPQVRHHRRQDESEAESNTGKGGDTRAAKAIDQDARQRHRDDGAKCNGE